MLKSELYYKQIMEVEKAGIPIEYNLYISTYGYLVCRVKMINGHYYSERQRTAGLQKLDEVWRSIYDKESEEIAIKANSKSKEKDH